jgi:hypothetical protein
LRLVQVLWVPLIVIKAVPPQADQARSTRERALGCSAADPPKTKLPALAARRREAQSPGCTVRSEAQDQAVAIRQIAARRLDLPCGKQVPRHLSVPPPFPRNSASSGRIRRVRACTARTLERSDLSRKFKRLVHSWCTTGERLPGGDEGDRTLDLRIANATLSQLSYVPTPAILPSAMGGVQGRRAADKLHTLRSRGARGRQ